MNVQIEQMSPISERQTRPSGAEFVSEVSDLAAGAGIFLFAVAPFALPALALVAVVMAIVAVALIIPLLVAAAVAAPILLMRRWWRSRDRTIAAGRRRDDHRGTRRIERERKARQGVAGHRSELA